MNSPLRLIRDLLPFAPADTGTKAAATARSLLDTIAGLAPEEVVVKLSSKILPGILKEPDLQSRFKLLEEIREEAERSLPVLEQHVSESALPLPVQTTGVALHADNLLKGLCLAYAGIARAIELHHQTESLSQRYHRALHRSVNLLARRQLLAYRAYTMPSSGSWQLLHELYRKACQPHTKPLNGETAPIEHEYLCALVFAYLEPSKLPRGELEQAHECTRKLAAYALISEISPEQAIGKPEARYLVLPDEGHAGHALMRLPDGVSTAGGFIIDCAPVLAAIDKNLERRPGKPIEPDLESSPALLESLRVALASKRNRRFGRSRFQPRADLICGLDQVLSFIQDHAFSRRSVDRVQRDESDLRTSEWALIDESPDGFLIRFVKGNKQKIGAGDIIALQPREASKVHVCLVRRIVATQMRLEVGLQLLSPHVSVANVRSENGDDVRAIFLHSLPAFGQFSGLIVPPDRFVQGQRVAIHLPGKSIYRQIGKRIEGHDQLEFLALDLLPD